MHTAVSRSSHDLTCIECPFVRSVIRKALGIREQGYGLVRLHGYFKSKRFTQFVNKLVFAKECGVFQTVLREAERCGVLEEVIDGAATANLMEDVLLNAEKLGVLSHVVYHYNRYHFRLLIGILRKAYQCGAGLEQEEITKVVQYCFSHIPETFVEFTSSIEMLQKILIQAGKCEAVEAVVEAAEKRGKLNKVLEAAKCAGLLSNVLQHCFRVCPGSVVKFVSSANMLNDVLMEAERCGEVEVVVAAAKKRNVISGPFFQDFETFISSSYLSFANLFDFFPFWKYWDIHPLCYFIKLLFAFIIWCCSHCNLNYRRNSHSSGDHRKSVINHVTMLSGDIEKNPGPTFLFNDWLKDMYALSVRVIHGCQGRRIPWKKLHRPDPYNGKLNRSQLTALFNETLLQNAGSIVPSTYTDEFQHLITYIRTRQEPDLGQLEDLVETRKLKMALEENLKKLQSCSPARQQEIVSSLDRQHLQFTVTHARQPAVIEEENAESENEEPGGHSTEGGDEESQHAQGSAEGQIRKSSEQRLIDNGSSDFHQGESAQELEFLLDLLDREGSSDDIAEEEQTNGTLAGGTTENGSIPNDTLEWILDSYEDSCNSAAKHNTVMVDVTLKSLDFCHNDTPQQNTETAFSTRLDLLQKKHEILMWNIERLTGLKDVDVCAYSTEDIEKLSEQNILHRKRRRSTDQVHSDAPVTKQRKCQ